MDTNYEMDLQYKMHLQRQEYAAHHPEKEAMLAEQQQRAADARAAQDKDMADVAARLAATLRRDTENVVAHAQRLEIQAQESEARAVVFRQENEARKAAREKANKEAAEREEAHRLSRQNH